MRRKNNNSNNKEQAAHMAASMMMGAIMAKAFNDVFGDENPTECKPFDGIRKVSKNCLESGVIIPDDGTAKELPVPEGFEVFISEDGKPMIYKKAKEQTEKNKKSEEMPITYDDVAKKLFSKKKVFFNSGNEVECIDFNIDDNVSDYDNCVTEKQAYRLLAFNKLQNIAKYLNKGWKPDFNDSSTEKWFILKSKGEYKIAHNTYAMSTNPYFKTEELAKEAIRIMGEESLADLFDTNW